MSRNGPTGQPVPGRPRDMQRVRPLHVEWVAERLSDRDWQIIEAINRLRLLSGDQLERLCFATLTGHARTVVRGRVLRRLVQWQVLTILPRRIGGAARGSTGSVFALGTAGARLSAEQQVTTSLPRVRHPGAPTDRSVRHTLAVSDLYVCLVERAHTQGAQVVAFEAEPASWWPNGLGGFIKPDAYACLSLGNVREHWWVEVDLATESLPTVKRKLLAYLDFMERGQLGPRNLVPRILISASTVVRCMAIGSVIEKLSAPAADLFVTSSGFQAAADLLHSLQE